MNDAWKKAPVSLEICGTFLRWKDTEGYNREDVKIIDQSLKWQLTNKTSPQMDDLVNDWLEDGYRFLRRFSYPESIAPNEKLSFTSWWENKGVAPCYKNSFTFRLKIKYKRKTMLNYRMDARNNL